MARIQVLELPSQQVGEYYNTPFVLVIDQVESEAVEKIDFNDGRYVALPPASELTQEEADTIATQAGAVSAILVACTLDVR